MALDLLDHRSPQSDHCASVYSQDQSSRPKATSIKIGPYILGQTIGRGSTAKVKTGHHELTRQKVAIKVLSKDKLTGDNVLKAKVLRECALLKLVDHENVLRLMDLLETDTHLYLIMEYMPGGDLYDYITKNERLPEPEAIRVFRELVRGLAHCHSMGICHRDVKPENILLDEFSRIKIADFGMASLMHSGKLLTSSCGSPQYVSPEIIMHREYDGRQTDVWSLGVVLYAMLTGSLPFDDDNMYILLRKIRSGQYEVPKDLSADSVDLIKQMLNVDPNARISLAEICRHPFYLLGATQEDLSRDRAAFTPANQALAVSRSSPLDSSVLDCLTALGFGSRSDVVAQLQSLDPRPIHFYYSHLLTHLDNSKSVLDDLSFTFPNLSPSQQPSTPSTFISPFAPTPRTSLTSPRPPPLTLDVPFDRAPYPLHPAQLALAIASVTRRPEPTTPIPKSSIVWTSSLAAAIPPTPCLSPSEFKPAPSSRSRRPDVCNNHPSLALPPLLISEPHSKSQCDAPRQHYVDLPTTSRVPRCWASIHSNHLLPGPIPTPSSRVQSQCSADDEPNESPRSLHAPSATPFRTELFSHLHPNPSSLSSFSQLSQPLYQYSQRSPCSQDTLRPCAQAGPTVPLAQLPPSPTSSLLGAIETRPRGSYQVLASRSRMSGTSGALASATAPSGPSADSDSASRPSPVRTASSALRLRSDSDLHPDADAAPRDRPAPRRLQPYTSRGVSPCAGWNSLSNSNLNLNPSLSSSLTVGATLLRPIPLSPGSSSNLLTTRVFRHVDQVKARNIQQRSVAIYGDRRA